MYVHVFFSVLVCLSLCGVKVEDECIYSNVKKNLNFSSLCIMLGSENI